MSLTLPKATATTRAATGQVVLLSGASQGIGRATARALAARGFRLGLMDRAEGPLVALAGELAAAGAKVAARVADVRDGEAVKEAVAALEREVGPTDVVVTCAGVGKLSSVPDLDLEGFRQMLDVNVLGMARTIEAVLPGMFARRGGHIVGIASVAGYRGLPWMPGYSASKAAVATYLEGLRPALKLRGVRITTVYPGFVRTGLTAETPFRYPVKMLEASEAAEYLVRAIVRRPRDLTFPLSAAFNMGLLRRLPGRIFDWAMDRAGPRALTSEF
jgi:NADP-dependent 3-hydroxy acid dehydrogenase YdfG